MVVEWVKSNIVVPVEFELDQEHCLSLEADHSFSPARFVDRGYTVWNVQADETMTYRMKFAQSDDTEKAFDLAGRADYLITHRTTPSGVLTAKADLVKAVLCVIMVPPKNDKDTFLREIELQLNLILAMNVGALPGAVGFLVQNNGMCRTYRATRNPKAVMYEQDDLVHVTHLVDVFEKMLALI